MCAMNCNKIRRKNRKRDFDFFARQMILKYRVAVAIATMKTKPNNISIDQHINILKNKMEETTDYDSDMTICSDDFQLNDDNDHDEAIDVTRSEVITGTQDTDTSANILEGFNLDNFLDDDGDELNAISQVISSLKPVKDDPKIDKIKDKLNKDAQVRSIEDPQSQSLLEEFEMIQNSLTFYQSDGRNGDELIVGDVVDGKEKVKSLKYDSQKTELYSIRDYTTYFNSHISQSQTQYVKIAHNHLFKAAADRNDPNQEIDKPKDVNASTQTPDNPIGDAGGDPNDNNRFVLNTNEEIGVSNRQHVETCDRRQVFDDSEVNDNRYESKDTQTNLDGAGEVEVDGMDDDLDTEEVIPFKVVEELNRVKTFLNKRNRDTAEECAIDSGYRSESQKRSYKGSAAEQDKWLNRSAQCLVDFLANSPMVPRARDIISDISSVLGRVIDRLHIEEKYPAFTEEILDLIQKLLNDIYANDSCAQDVIFQVDEKINRLLLFNTSHHIIKYTIEKVVAALEQFHSLMNEETLLELTNTDEMENACYVLHVLEVLLRRYSATDGTRSLASTQPSQDDRLKRSSVTDIWRRKWNNCKPDAERAAAEGRSLESRCTEVLNRLIVDAVSGYGLVSFAALQCFNLLKT